MKAGGGGGTSGPSFTTLSTIVVQAGQSQLVVSVLKSGSQVHLQLVQVLPSLCEMGSNQEENRTLIQEQQQLMERLKKHQREVLALVERPRRRVSEQQEEEEKEEVYEAMAASLSEGWSLLLRLLQRRQEVLMLASDFYHRALEFVDGMDRVEDAQTGPDVHRLAYDSMRRDLLGKSLRVISSSSVLLQKVRQLQRVEALHRRGAVLQDKEDQEGSQASRGAALRLEELVEALQDRRRRLDQAARLVYERRRKSKPDDWTIIPEQNLQPGSTTNGSGDLDPESRAGVTLGSGMEDNRRLQPKCRADLNPESKVDINIYISEKTREIESEFRSNGEAGSTSEKDKDLQSGSSSVETLELEFGSSSNLEPESLSEKTRTQQRGSRSDLQLDSTSEETRACSASRSDVKPRSKIDSRSREILNLQLGSRSETSEFKVQTRPRLERTEDLKSKSALAESKDLQPGAEDTRDLLSGSKSDVQSPSESDLKLESGSKECKGRIHGSRSDIQSGPLSDLQPGFSSGPKSASTHGEIKNLQSRFRLNLTTGSTSALKSAFKSEETRDCQPGSSSLLMPCSRSRETRELQPESRSVQMPGSTSETNKFNIHSTLKLERTVDLLSKSPSDLQPGSGSEVSGSDLDLPVSTAGQMMEKLKRNKQELNEMQTNKRIRQQQEVMKNRRMFQDRLVKTLQDLSCVSELLDSCTSLDLGSELQTSNLLQRFTQARPHFTKLDAEVEYLMRSWESLRGVQEEKEVKEEKLSQLLKLHNNVKNKIHQSESILDRTTSFHLTAKQLEALLHSHPAKEEQLVQNLFNTAATLKTHICTAVSHSDWTGFRLQQLDLRLRSLDSLCVSWLNEASRREETLHRELLSRLLSDDITQLRESLKELRKRFNNLKFNYLKKNSRTRNTKAVRNQLQQVELYDHKLQVLRKRLPAAAAGLGSEVKEAEDAVNELQRQMGELEQSVGEHLQTLDMNLRLLEATEEYELWREEAGATIARVARFSSECRRSEDAALLYRQFEKFVWPTVPQQEERMDQITELAVRLHGVEEGRRYVQKMEAKHSQTVASIRELSHGLMELEVRLKSENLKLQRNDDGQNAEQEEELERRRQSVAPEKENQFKEEVDHHGSQEAADMRELKETGHTPELTAEHDGKRVPVKRQTAADRKPPLHKSRSQEAEKQAVVSEISERFTSSYTLSFSCSKVEAHSQLAVHSRSQPEATTPPFLVGPVDVQRACHRKEMGQQDATGLVEAELQQLQAMTEDSLSNDEYDECVSPDDISLPPLAETPESGMVQSDPEEGLSFSSHSVHVNQLSHRRFRSETGSFAPHLSHDTPGHNPAPRRRSLSETDLHQYKQRVSRPLNKHPGPLSQTIFNTTSSITRHTVHGHSSSLETSCPVSQGNNKSPDVHAPISPDTSNSITQPCARDPPPTAHLHVPAPPTASHPLTSHPDICRPVSIREEIRLTPQIQGPPLPAPPPPVPRGAASEPGPPVITRPVSRATVTEGSAVMLEVEVTGHPEPTLTCRSRCEEGGVSAAGCFLSETDDHRSGDQWLVPEVMEGMSEDWYSWLGSLCVLLWLVCLMLL